MTERPDPLADLAKPSKREPLTPTNENPWLMALASIGLLGTFAGVLLVIVGTNQQTMFNDRSGMILVGAALAGLGITAMVGWLAAAAVCWQLRQRD